MAFVISNSEKEFPMLQFFKDLQSTAATTLAKYNNSTFKDGLMGVCALVAAADGEVEKEEKSKVAALIQKNEMLSVFNGTELRDTFLKFADQAGDEFSRLDVLNVVRKLKSNPGQADTALKIGLIIANADGEFEPQEKKVVAELCTMLGLLPSDYGV